VISLLQKIKRIGLYGAPLALLGTVLATNIASAQVIPTASSTAMVTSISTNVWDVFYTNFPLVVGVVVLFTIVIALASWLLAKIGSIGRHK